MSTILSRRAFLQQAGVAAGALGGASIFQDWVLAEVKPQAEGAIPPLTLISGKPRERGRMYGSRFRDGIHAFLDREIYQAFTQKPSPKDAMLAYAGACGKEVKQYSAVIRDELEAIAEGSGLKLEEILRSEERRVGKE